MGHKKVLIKVADMKIGGPKQHERAEELEKMFDKHGDYLSIAEVIDIATGDPKEYPSTYASFAKAEKDPATAIRKWQHVLLGSAIRSIREKVKSPKLLASYRVFMSVIIDGQRKITKTRRVLVDPELRKAVRLELEIRMTGATNSRNNYVTFAKVLGVKV